MLLEKDPTIVDETNLLMVVRTMLFIVMLNRHASTTLFRQGTTRVDELTGGCKLLNSCQQYLVTTRCFKRQFDCDKPILLAAINFMTQNK